MSLHRKTLATVSAAALIAGFASAAHAQQTAPSDVEALVVTGSRIVRNGYQATTPTLVTTVDDLQRLSPASITEGLAKLPVFNGSTSQTGSGQGSLGSGGVNQTGNFLNLRNFGTIRTLILLDGRRVPPTNFDGNVDVDSLPQALVQRVDVVTGGASAVYGSDAVTGVVNYILDHNFVGVKGKVQGGISDYRDDRSYRLSIAGGKELFEGRGHLLLSAEHSSRDGVKTKESRPWFNGQLLTGAGTAANPYHTIQNGLVNTASFGGLVTTGPFAGQTFLPNGQLKVFDPGLPSGTIGFGAGGDGASHAFTSLSASLRTEQLFGRFEYDFGNSIKAFVQANFAEQESKHSQATPNRTASGPSKIVIFSGNPYLRPEVQAQLTATNTASFIVSEYGIDLGRPYFDITTQSKSFTAGLSGDLFGDLKWDAAFTHGEGRTRQDQMRNSNNQHFYAAVDAVRDPSGQIVCRVTLTSPGLYPGCVPINALGRANATQAAIEYTTNTTGWNAVNKSDDFVFNVAGDLFNNWAGPVSIAVGAEYRKQSLNQTTTDDPTVAPDFTGLRGGFTSTTLSYVGVLVAAAKGSNKVSEANAEIVFPLLTDAPLAKNLEFNGAVRHTDYSNSGGVNTWKAGLNYQPVEDLRFRFVKSRDIRAPTLYDLYAATQVRNSGLTDPLTNVSLTAREVQGGNPNLEPEVSNTEIAGLVYSPSWLPRFNVSIDYYKIKISNAIGSVGTTTQIQQCIASGGTSPFCSQVIRPFPITNTTPANYPTMFYTQSLNIAQTKTKGVDVEMSYNTDLADVYEPLRGTLNLRMVASYQPELVSRSYEGAQRLNATGVAGLPKMRVSLQANYKNGPFGLNVQERWRSGGVWNSNRSLVYSDPDFPAYKVFDLGVTYDATVRGVDLQGFANISNLLNVEPQIKATDSPGQVTPIVAGQDAIGRYFTVGVRFKL